MNRSIAQFLSYLFHPAAAPVLGILAVLRLTPFYVESSMLIVAVCLVFAGTYVIPILFSLVLYRLGILPGLEMKTANERKIPYLIGALCYYLVAVLIQRLNLPREGYLYLLASTLVIIIHLICLIRFKPSAHMAGIGGLTGLLIALSLKFSVNLLPFLAAVILVSGFLASARLYLKAHNAGELVFGYFSGLLIVFFTVFLG